MGKINVWTMHKSKKIQVTDDPGVPTEVTGYVSPEAAAAAQARGHATVSEIGFNRDDWATFDDWGEAQKFANEKATELGYAVDGYSVFEAWADDEDYDHEDDSWIDDEDDYEWYPEDDEDEDDV